MGGVGGSERLSDGFRRNEGRKGGESGMDRQKVDVIVMRLRRFRSFRSIESAEVKSVH